MQAIKQALSNLRQKVAPCSEQVPSVARESVPDFPASEDELDSMMTLLADFIGPIATIIMEEHETKSTSANNLAIEISKEIPQQEMQEEFLKRWKMMSVSRRALLSKKMSDGSSNKTMPHPSKGAVPHRTGDDFTNYFGTFAKTVFRHNR
jgi:hypothetical protein